MFGMTSVTLFVPPAVCGRIQEYCCREGSSAVCTVLVAYNLGDSFRLPSSLPLLWITFMCLLHRVSGVRLLCFITSLKICLTVSLVASSNKCFDAFRSDSIFVTCFTFLLSLFTAVCNSSSVNLEYFFAASLIVVFFIVVCSCIRIHFVLQLFSKIFHLHSLWCSILRRHLQCHISM